MVSLPKEEESQGRRRLEGSILDLVEYDAVGVIDSEKSNDGAQDSHANHDLVVGDGEEEDIVVLNALRGVVGIFLALSLRLEPHRRLLVRWCASWASHAAEMDLDREGRVGRWRIGKEALKLELRLCRRSRIGGKEN